MKIGISAALLFLLSFLSTQASALSVTPTQPLSENSGLLITAYGVSGAGASLDVLQIYNNNDSVFSLKGWTIGVITTLQATPKPLFSLDGYMKAESHGVYSLTGSISGASVHAVSYPALISGEKILKIVLIAPEAAVANLEQPIATADGVYRRNVTSTGYSTSTTFSKLNEPIILYADEPYNIPEVPHLRIVEVLAHHAECAPNDRSAVCGDYVKLQNIGETAIDMSQYRLRTDSSTSESSNAFSLAGELAPQAYATVTLRDDGGLMSLNDSGGYVWLEDAAGLMPYYDDTMAQYPSASSTTKVGWSWVLDASDASWKWTSTPQPNANNLISVPAEPVSIPKPVITALTDCPAGKYRSPETNRCRSLEEAVNVLAQCEEGKERNPATNRCRSVATLASSTLTPCDEDQERNPITNRCRAVAGASTMALTPCQAGYERNPATNRCRKALSLTTAPASTPAAVQDAGDSTLKTALLVITGAGVASYGLYEWRSELGRLLRRAIPTRAK